MTTDHTATSVGRPDIQAEFDAFWAHAAAPGATLTGAERVAVLGYARAAWGDDSTSARGGTAVEDVARRVGGDPASIDQGWVEEAADSIGFSTYVETVALGAMGSAVDTFHRALDLALPVLPTPEAGEPTGVINAAARVRAAWVPIEGPAAVTQCLNLVPAENDMRVALSAPLYLLDELVVDPHANHELSRPQVELIASRTSAINDCYF